MWLLTALSDIAAPESTGKRSPEVKSALPPPRLATWLSTWPGEDSNIVKVLFDSSELVSKCLHIEKIWNIQMIKCGMGYKSYLSI